MPSFRGPDNSERFPDNQRDFSRGRAIFKKNESPQMILISEIERSDEFHSLVIPVERLRCCRIGKIHSEASRLAGLHSKGASKPSRRWNFVDSRWQWPLRGLLMVDVRSWMR